MSDAYGLYYLRRGKSSAALDYVQKAMKTHARMQVRERVGAGGRGAMFRGILKAEIVVFFLFFWRG